MKPFIGEIILLFVITQILMQCIVVECEPEPKRVKGKGRGKAFGAGILAGGFAGAIAGHVLTRQNNPTQHHHHHYVNPSNGLPAATPVPAPIAQARPPTIIDRGETLSNGCYKQTIKEPDFYDSTRFIETERLVCPPGVPVIIHEPQPVVPAMHMIPVVPIQPAAATQPAAQPQPTLQSPNIHDPSQLPSIVPIYTAPLAPLIPVPQTPHPHQQPNIHDPSQFPPLEPVYTAPLAPIMPVPQLPQHPVEGSTPVVPVVTEQQPQPAAVLPVVTQSPPQPGFIYPAAYIPQSQPAAVVPVVTPHQPQPAVVHSQQPLAPVPQSQPAVVMPVVPQPQPAFVYPAAPIPQPQPAAVIPVVTQHQPQPAFVHPQQPAAPAQVPASNSVNSNVIVLSKKTGFYEDTKKKNGANRLLTTHNVFMLFLIVFFI